MKNLVKTWHKNKTFNTKTHGYAILKPGYYDRTGRVQGKILSRSLLIYCMEDVIITGFHALLYIYVLGDLGGWAKYFYSFRAEMIVQGACKKALLRFVFLKDYVSNVTEKVIIIRVILPSLALPILHTNVCPSTVALARLFSLPRIL